MDEKTFVRLEWWGIPAVLAAMLALHYGYRLSSGAMWSILFGAVNESAWEHIKTMILPYLGWAAAELCAVRIPLRRMVAAKAAGVFAGAGAIAGLFFVGLLIPGIQLTMWHLLCSAAGVALAQGISLLLITREVKTEGWFAVAAFALVLLLAMYLTFTVNPPKMILFQDLDTGAYGLLPRPVDSGVLFGEGLLT